MVSKLRNPGEEGTSGMKHTLSFKETDYINELGNFVSNVQLDISGNISDNGITYFNSDIGYLTKDKLNCEVYINNTNENVGLTETIKTEIANKLSAGSKNKLIYTINNQDNKCIFDVKKQNSDNINIDIGKMFSLILIAV